MDVLISMAAKHLLKDGLKVLQNHSIIDQLTIPGDGHPSGFTDTNTISSLVIKTASRNT
jgi:hypothetical protein